MVLCIFILYKNILLNKEKESENIDSSIHCTFNTSHSYPSHNISYRYQVSLPLITLFVTCTPS